MKIISEVNREMVSELFLDLNIKYYCCYWEAQNNKHKKLWEIYNRYRLGGNNSLFEIKNIATKDLKYFYINLLKL